MPVGKFALKPVVPSPQSIRFEGDGLQLYRLIHADGAEPLLGFPGLSQAGKLTIDTTSGQLMFG
jgi:hypothetical protein